MELCGCNAIAYLHKRTQRKKKEVGCALVLRKRGCSGRTPCREAIKCMKNRPQMLNICINVGYILPHRPEGGFSSQAYFACLLLAVAHPVRQDWSRNRLNGSKAPCACSLFLTQRPQLLPYKNGQLDGSLHCFRQMPRLFVVIKNKTRGSAKRRALQTGRNRTNGAGNKIVMLELE